MNIDEEFEKRLARTAERWLDLHHSKERMHETIRVEWAVATGSKVDKIPDLKIPSPRRVARVWSRFTRGAPSIGVWTDHLDRIALLLALANGVNGNPRIDFRKMLDEDWVSDEDVNEALMWLDAKIRLETGEVRNPEDFEFWKSEKRVDMSEIRPHQRDMMKHATRVIDPTKIDLAEIEKTMAKKIEPGAVLSVGKDES